MRKREELVQAKGKGEIQTYWIKGKVSSSHQSDSEVFRHSTGSGNNSPDRSLTSDTVDSIGQVVAHKSRVRQSLVSWQVELLSRLIKQIVLHRSMKTSKTTEDLVTLDTAKLLPRDQVTEKIAMPEYDESIGRNTRKVDSVDLPDAVVSQLNDLVSTIARLYNDNSFHNFEHACHVTMSANKLLKRIVVPTMQGTKDNMKKAHDFTYGLTSDPLTQFAIIFSAIVHDLDHHGVSNQQLVKEQNRLAVMYQDKSVAEQNSIDLAFDLLTSGSFADLLSCICEDDNEYKRFRQLVVNGVMATDMYVYRILDDQAPLHAK